MITTRMMDPSCTLPLVVESQPETGDKNSTSLASWYQENEAFVRARLLEHGAILFRGFGINTPAAFARFTRSVSKNLIDGKEENVPRTKLTAGVYTSSEYPAEYMLSMHSEHSYSHHWPARLFFCCITAAREGGETPVADNRKILKNLDPEIVDEFRRKKVMYLRLLHDGQGFGLSWQTAFQTSDKKVVENYCRESGIDFAWAPGSGLRLRQTLDGIISHPATGEPVWFNQAPQFHPSDYPPEIYRSLHDTYKDEFPQSVCFGDGTPMGSAMLQKIRETMRQSAISYPWQEGDLLLLDNVLASHGRMPFVGPRKILVAMSKD